MAPARLCWSAAIWMLCRCTKRPALPTRAPSRRKTTRAKKYQSRTRAGTTFTCPRSSAPRALSRNSRTNGMAPSFSSASQQRRPSGGRGAHPHKTKDPIVLSAQIINAWQTIASRENNPIDPVVITVGSIHGGAKHNIIPDEVKMQLTVRTYKKEVREKVLAAIERIAKDCATAFGIPPGKLPEVHVRQDEFSPATYNNPELTKSVAATLKTALGNDKVVSKDPSMGA